MLGFSFRAVKILPEAVSSLISDCRSSDTPKETTRSGGMCPGKKDHRLWLLGPVLEGCLAAQIGAELVGSAALLTFLSKGYLGAGWSLM